jgi:proteasome lid subunit RPN8/RPN11
MKMTRKIWDKIVVHAKKDAPIEACGYLAEKNGIIVRQYPLKNIDESGEHFTFNPKDQFKAVRDMRSKRLMLFGVYHSHPASPARPSEEDIRLAYDPTISYVIISLAHGKETVKSFKIQKGKVKQEEIKIIEENEIK